MTFARRRDTAATTDVVRRAIESDGGSNPAAHRLLLAALDARQPAPAVLVDVGCGRGDFYSLTRNRIERYVGVDVIRHTGCPPELEMTEANLDREPIPLPDGYADAVVCVETIEHVENPRALMRELVRIARPHGWVFVTTPNQLSAASLLCLLARGQFQYFQEGPGLYPAHISALLEVDLRRVATECGLVDIDVMYSGSGRIPFSTREWPAPLSASRGFRGRTFSDNVLVCGRKG